jgi:hypothetical protein
MVRMLPDRLQWTVMVHYSSFSKRRARWRKVRTGVPDGP